MKLFQGKQEDYRKNLVCMEEVTDRLLGHMKGHGFSFRQEITDSKGDFSQEKLCGLVEELVERWAETLRESTDTDPGTGESLAEPYIRERRPLPLPGHAVQPVPGGVCESLSLRLCGERADGFCIPAGAGQAPDQKMVRHGRARRWETQRAVRGL